MKEFEDDRRGRDKGGEECLHFRTNHQKMLIGFSLSLPVKTDADLVS